VYTKNRFSNTASKKPPLFPENRENGLTYILFFSKKNIKKQIKSNHINEFNEKIDFAKSRKWAPYTLKKSLKYQKKLKNK
jgi:hypothetical protein